MLKLQLMKYFLLSSFINICGEKQINHKTSNSFQLNLLDKKNLEEKILLKNISNYCNNNISVNRDLNEEEIKNNILNPNIYSVYVNKNEKSSEKILQIKANKYNNFFLWQIIPEIETDDFQQYKLYLNGSKLIEALFQNIFPYKTNKMIYEKKQLQKELIFDFQEQLKNLIKLIGNIRSKYRSYKYILEELLNKNNNRKILASENELENLFLLENSLLELSIELTNLFGQLEDIIIKSNFTIHQSHIDDLFLLYNKIHIHIKKKTNDYNNNEYINIENLEELKKTIKNDYIKNKNKLVMRQPLLPKQNLFQNFFQKLPVTIKLSLTKYFKFHMDKKEHTFILSISQLIQIIINYIFNKKIDENTILDENKQWNNLIKNQENNNKNLLEKYENTKKTLEVLKVILNNEELLSVIKLKKSIDYYKSFIDGEEEIISNILLQINSEIILIKE